MHIEKINEHKIKFILSQDDLKKQDIKFSELAYGSDKAQSLFMDMMDEAYEKFGFDVDNAPLMIEAIPLEEDSIMILVTKVTSPQEIDQKLEDISSSERKVKKSPKTNSRKKTSQKSARIIYEFDDFENISLATSRLQGIYTNASSLYKFENKYYLFLKANRFTIKAQNALHSVLGEYGIQISSSPLTEGWLNERADLLIENNAVEVFNQYFR